MLLLDPGGMLTVIGTLQIFIDHADADDDDETDDV